MACSPCKSKDTTTVDIFHNDLLGRDEMDCHPIRSITDLQDALDAKIDDAGDTMTGRLTLSSDDPIDPFHAATKAYVDAVAAGGGTDTFVLKIGDNMTGFLTLHDDPALPYHAATKQYVDSKASTDYVSTSGDTMTGALTLYADGTDPLHAVTFQQFDSAITDLKADAETHLTGNPVDVNDNILHVKRTGTPVPTIEAGLTLLADPDLETIDYFTDPSLPLMQSIGYDTEPGFSVGPNGDVLIGKLPINRDGSTTGDLGIALTKKGTIAINSESDYPTILIKQTADHTENTMEVYDENEEIGFTINKDGECIVGGNPLIGGTGAIMAKNGRIACYAGPGAASTQLPFLVYRSGLQTGIAVQADGKFFVSSDASRGYTGFSVDKYGSTYIDCSSGSYTFSAQSPNGQYFRIQTDGAAVIGGNPYSGQTGVAILANSGGIKASGTVSANNFSTTSDVRLKTNIHDITNEADNIKKLKPVSFNWKNDNKASVGLVAQQVQKIYPDAVEIEEDGYLSVDYNYVFTIMLAQVQKLEKRIEELEDI